MHSFAKNNWVSGLLLVLLVLLLGACQKDDPNAMGASMPPAGNPGGAPKASANAKPKGDLAKRPGLAGDKLPAKDAAAEEPTGPQVELTNLLVDPPAIDFTGPGRYNVTVDAKASEPVDPSVWSVIAYGEDGKKVGSQVLYLTLNHVEPRQLFLNDFFCKAIPVRIELKLEPEMVADSSGSGTGKDEGGSTKPGGRGNAAAGGGAPPKGGGSTPPKGDSKPPTGGSDEGDQSGAGEGDE